MELAGLSAIQVDMIKSGARRFRKCGICGTHGHIDAKCPLAEYEKELEAGTADLITAEKLFPNNPELIAKLQFVQQSYRHGEKPRITESAEHVTIDYMAARLRQAWGIGGTA